MGGRRELEGAWFAPCKGQEEERKGGEGGGVNKEEGEGVGSNERREKERRGEKGHTRNGPQEHR